MSFNGEPMTVLAKLDMAGGLVRAADMWNVVGMRYVAV
jgi:hypothetical protein